MPGESIDILGTLVVVVLKAQNLIDNHTFYKQDPYAQLSLNGTVQKTPVDPKGGQHPVWDEEFRFPIPSNIATKKKALKVACYSQEKKEDTLLGEGEIDISDTLRSGEFDDWVPLKIGDTQRGEIYLEMTFFSAGPAPLQRRKSKFTPQERLARPPQASLPPQAQQRPTAQAQQRLPAQVQQQPLPQSQRQSTASQLPPAQFRPGYASHTAGNPQPNRSSQQHLAVPGRSHSGSPKDPESALPPLPEEPPVPAILRPGPATRPRVVSDVGPGHRPSFSSTTPTIQRPHEEPDLPTPTQYNPRPTPYSSNGTPAPLATVPTPAQTPHSAPARTPSYPPPTAEPYKSPYPPYHTPVPASGPTGTSPPRQPSHSVSGYTSSLPPAGFAFPVPDVNPAPTPAPNTRNSTPAVYPRSVQYPPPSTSYGSTPTPAPHGTAAPYVPPAQPYTTSPPRNTATLPYQPSIAAYPPRATSPYVAPPASYQPTTPPYHTAPNTFFAAPPPPGPYPYGHPLHSRNTSLQPAADGLPDPYLERRYQTPLPLPRDGSLQPQSTPPAPAPAPAPSPVAAAAPVPAPAPPVHIAQPAKPLSPRLSPDEIAAREFQRREEEEEARARREQEERDAEFARSLDMELNLGPDGTTAPRRDASGTNMPGAW